MIFARAFCGIVLSVPLFFLTSCYYSRLPHVSGEDALDSKGNTLTGGETNWINLGWIREPNEISIVFNKNGSYEFTSHIDLEDSPPLATSESLSFEKLSNNFYIVQSGRIGKSTKESLFFYRLAYVFDDKIFIWQLDKGTEYRNLKSNKNVELFSECYKLQYGKFPEKDEDSLYVFSWSLKADLLTCSNYIKENHISPDSIVELY